MKAIALARENLTALRNRLSCSCRYFLAIWPRSIGRPETGIGLPSSVTLRAMSLWIDDSEGGGALSDDPSLHPTRPTARMSIAAARMEVRRRVLMLSGNIAKPSRLSIRLPVAPSAPLPTPIMPASLISGKNEAVRLLAPDNAVQSEDERFASADGNRQWRREREDCARGDFGRLDRRASDCLYEFTHGLRQRGPERIFDVSGRTAQIQVTSRDVFGARSMIEKRSPISETERQKLSADNPAAQPNRL